MYQREGKKAYKADLSNALRLEEYLGHPSRTFKTVHVAGTNGKGSVSHMLAAVFQQSGYKTGLYTSPHLKDFRERIRVDGTMIPKEAVVQFVSRHRPFFERNKLSFFEMTVGMAFDHFRSEQVDIAIIEVGLGGRLDSTNIIMPQLAVITNIGFDHMEFLGDTLPLIAREKAGIIKPGIPALIGLSQPETRPVFEAVAIEKEAPLYFAQEMELPTMPSSLEGPYQVENSRTALAAVELLRKSGWKLAANDVAEGLGRVTELTGLIGRWHWIGKRPNILCDTAHNLEGLTLVLKAIGQLRYEELHIVLGTLSDKSLDGILPLFPRKARYYFCRPDIPRGLDAFRLMEQASSFGLKGLAFPTVKEALQAAREAASSEDLIYVGGSTFTVAEVV